MQHARGFIVGCANRVTLISWEAEHTKQQIGQAFMGKKPHIISILHTGYKVIGYTFAKQTFVPIGTNFMGYMFTKQFYWYNFPGFCSNLKQFYWYKRSGLLFKLRCPWAFQLSRGLFTGCILIGWLQVTRWGRGILPFHGKPKPKSRLPASPSPGSPT